ncbi:hypothetical protein PT974_11263 [Cladobotryum mycophilum]|uniref:SUZ domain-containing protein n=1 Tax=Cladobotryum mycophilum TaxID=491253 RepID=A0ABR0S4R1_9HYPO
MDPPVTASTSNTPPPAVLPRKIMRRGQDDEGGMMSAGASKATSETGSDGKDKQPLASQKLSREEREEKYKLARQRIFGSTEETPPENDGDYGMSRTSSVSATNKSASGKRAKITKQRRDDSDSFETRRQYTPYWGPQQQTWVPQPQAQYVPPAAGQFSAQPAPTYPQQMGPAYAQQPAVYPAAPSTPQNPTYPPYSMPQQYPPPPAQQRFQPVQPGGSPMTAYGSPVLSAAPPQPQGWQPGFNSPGYQARGPTPGGPPPGQPGIPYPFGQLPANLNPHDPKSQHPIPGSYNRNHAFNPKTQSFVPGGNGMPPQPLQPPFTAPGSHHSSPQIGTPHLAFGPHPSTIPPPYGGGYNMARQGSNNSMASYYAPPHITPPHVQHGPPPMQNMQNMQNMQHIPLSIYLRISRRLTFPTDRLFPRDQTKCLAVTYPPMATRQHCRRSQLPEFNEHQN